MSALKEAKKRKQDDVMAFLDRIPEWSRCQERNPKIARFTEAYLMMALRAAYRPQAPSDGFGHIQLSRTEVADCNRLAREALDYALAFDKAFDKEEDGCTFRIGCSNFCTNRAFALTIEAARVLAGGMDGEQHALALLKLAVEEVGRAKTERVTQRTVSLREPAGATPLT
jgi:hypothetical protein